MVDTCTYVGQDRLGREVEKRHRQRQARPYMVARAKKDRLCSSADSRLVPLAQIECAQPRWRRCSSLCPTRRAKVTRVAIHGCSAPRGMECALLGLRLGQLPEWSPLPLLLPPPLLPGPRMPRCQSVRARFVTDSPM